MKFDLSSVPNTIDLLHLSIGSIAIIESIIIVILLSILVIGLVRKDKTPPQIVTQAPVPEPQKPAVSSVTAAPKKPTAPLREATPDAALQLLGLLQQEARFIDFIEEDITAFSDADIGAAARIVHEGCSKILHNHFDFAPIRKEQENSRVTIKSGFDPAEVRLTGNIVGKAPFKGTLVHRGWRVSSIRLPKLADNHNVNILASAEVEL